MIFKILFMACAQMPIEKRVDCEITMAKCVRVLKDKRHNDLDAIELCLSFYGDEK